MKKRIYYRRLPVNEVTVVKKTTLDIPSVYLTLINISTAILESLAYLPHAFGYTSHAHQDVSRPI